MGQRLGHSDATTAVDGFDFGAKFSIEQDEKESTQRDLGFGLTEGRGDLRVGSRSISEMGYRREMLELVSLEVARY